ncbi:MAG: hypothetical protein HY880_07750 [Deltaproteobacteria bacterium]|nr:hypothetical protein [Deltaproteobacteria bacterium]
MAVSGDVSLLLDAFDNFKKASSSLEGYYKELEKKAEGLKKELAEKNNFLACVLEELPIGVVVTDVSNIVLNLNNAACQILEKTVDEVIGNVFEGAASHVSGEAEMTIAPKKSHARKKTVSVSITRLHDIDGADIGSLAVLRDISEIKRLGESAERTKRLTAMGEMAASIAHQIRNPLASMELFASILRDDLSEDAQKRRYTDEIILAVRTLNNAVSNMLIFANTSRPMLHNVQLSDFMHEVRNVANLLIYDKEVALAINPVPSGFFVSADKELLKQAVINLIMNAVDAASGHSNAVATVDCLYDNGSVHIIISDNGPGIAVEDAERIFDPFFTTKPKGTGLGLTVSNNIVKAHGGCIDMESRASEGTVFDIVLPIAEI